MIRLGIDLEQFRKEQGLTYQGLADLLGIKQNRQAIAYAVGETWPGTEMLEQILRKTDGAVDVFAMHQRRLKWLHENGRLKRGPVPVAFEAASGCSRMRPQVRG